MNCEQYQDEILLYVGSTELPADLQAHIDQCPDCASLWSELKRTSEQLLGTEPLIPRDIDVDHLIADTVSRLPEKKGRIIPVASLRYWSAAAAVVIVAGVVAIVTLFGSDSDKNTAQTSGAESSTGSSLVELYATDFDSPSDEVVDILIYDATEDGYMDAGETILSDLTADEVDYLEKNFDVREIL